MNNQNNSYPIFTEEPLITENRQPQLGNSNSNNQYVPPPAYPQGNSSIYIRRQYPTTCTLQRLQSKPKHGTSQSSFRGKSRFQP